MQIKQLLTSLHPKIHEMAFMSELTSGKFQREEILRSEVVELYRALDTRQKIQDIYKAKLAEGLKGGLITDEDLSVMNEVIDDEGETHDHIDHLDMRFNYLLEQVLREENFQFIMMKFKKLMTNGLIFVKKLIYGKLWPATVPLKVGILQFQRCLRRSIEKEVLWMKN